MECKKKLGGDDFIFGEKTASPVHPTLWIREVKGTALSGKTIVLGVTGSIAAVETVKLARELIRRGASVYAVMTDAACRIIHEEALHYATGNPVISKLTGRVEHVEFFGSKGTADLFLIAPATANTISKIAAGIDDTPVTTFATTAVGEGKKVMIVPAMHESMYRHPKVLENLKTLESYGIDIIGPRFEEGIAKIADSEEIVLRVLRALGDRSLTGKTVFVTSGSTAESIDPIRLLTNRASGKTGNALAKEAYIRGAEVYLFHRVKSEWGHLPHFHDIRAESVHEMIEAVTEKIALAPPVSGKNILISAAAISDYTVDAAASKIKSGERDLTIKLKPAKKLIEEACCADPNIFIVGFKAETGVSHQQLIESAASKIDAGIADIVVANDVKEKGMGTDENDVYAVTKDYLTHHDLKTVIPISGSKEKIAAELFDLICAEADFGAPQFFIDSEIKAAGPDDEREAAKHDTIISDSFEGTIGTDLNEETGSDSLTSDAFIFSGAPAPKKTLRRKPAQIRGRIFKRN
ncbi:MAG: bifunctional phosphopantothenoylcysteine decarboxylase/phosphopantothenate--cysteine ligase CoaBC [Methanosarcinales archaeon]|jgi:phosphopantothenoylcysteine decarboxylase/phosphopantothenate--cysteine ligase|nr:bifunctional phosphopantothenoylcysteine decarboxylase/phosphopantothenate--cysteine ligase CoaBC [Methanosarcinales archaeon]